MTARLPDGAAEPPAFEGHQPRECGEHRTVGSHRAWCYDDSEWCYPAEPCRGCTPACDHDEIARQAAAAEREACAQLAEQVRARYVVYELPEYTSAVRVPVLKPFADLIRARTTP